MSARFYNSSAYKSSRQIITVFREIIPCLGSLADFCFLDFFAWCSSWLEIDLGRELCASFKAAFSFEDKLLNLIFSSWYCGII